jgi:hypothetical protein
VYTVQGAMYNFNEPRTHGLQYNLKTTAAYIKRNDEDVKTIFLKVKQGRPRKAYVHAKTQPQAPLMHYISAH